MAVADAEAPGWDCSRISSISKDSVKRETRGRGAVLETRFALLARFELVMTVLKKRGKMMMSAIKMATVISALLIKG